MATDLTLHLDDQPGELARVSSLLGDAGVNISGFCAVTSGGGRAEVHVLVDDLAAAFTALAAGEITVASEQEVAVVAVEDRPGVLGEVSRRLGASGVNITLAYLATDTRLVFAADDLAAAKAALT
ncbi:MAG TPA: ACT domain-containing protein [Actinomycetes bacterium]|nr:ACT domain-containing protein [Actinomycetes bacterium]